MLIQGELQGECIGRDAADGAVGAELIVLGAPVFDEQTGLGERTEPMLVETVVAESAIEGLDESVLGGLAGLDVMEDDAGGLSPAMQSAADELRAVIGGDEGRPTTLLEE